MRKIFNILIALSLVFLSMSCDDSKRETPQGFVYLEDDVFKIDGEKFFPMMLNYKVNLMDFDDGLVFSATKYYDDPYIYEPTTKEEAREQFSSHMQLIEELGFNTIRLCIDIVSEDENGYFYRTQRDKMYLDKDRDKIIDAVEDMINTAASHNLKVMLLLRTAWDDKILRFNSAVMDRLSENKDIFAFDLMNEPLYFDIVVDRPKSDAVQVVEHWTKNARKHAPNHLITIGFAEPIEVFSYDPSVMPVDFVQIHTYNPLSIPNEIWWYSHFIGKPWMIGETSLPADNDSVTYEQQRLFAEQVCQYVVDCGGIGFGWWEFQDIPESYNINYEGSYSGILNHEGTTTTQTGYVIQGTLKPVAFAFANLKSLDKGEPTRSVNYYNNFGYHNAVITGRVVDDKTGQPVEGAAVRGWNRKWKTGLNTSTDEDGVFHLYSNDECVHFAISAPGMDTKRFEMYLEYRDKDGEAGDFTDLPDRYIKSSMVSYQKFLKAEDKLFEFKEDAFDKAVLFADMGEIRLKKLKK